MLERICIGTANFSKEYNGHKVSGKEQNLIMEYMKEVGIEWLDVATAYGTEMIGENAFRRILKCNTQWPYIDNTIVLAHDIYSYKPDFHSGASINDFIDYGTAQSFHICELPYSIMNHDIGLCHGTSHIARSIFCKGKALKYFSPRECIDFVLMNPRINKVILGVDSVDQLRENVAHLVKMETFKHNEEVDTRKFERKDL